jgi:hypothetical protein
MSINNKESYGDRQMNTPDCQIETQNIYRVSQKECARLREGVPYVKVYRYNPKHLCPKLNGYADNGQRKVWSSLGFHALYLSADSLSISILECGVILRLTLPLTAYLQADKVDQTLRDTGSLPSVMYSAWNRKDNYDMSASLTS